MASVEQLREQVVHVALSNVGFGEQTVNNDGPLIRAIGGKPGDEWCALLGGWAYRRGSVLCGLSEPSWCYRRPGVLEVGAKALGKALANQPGGVMFTDPMEAKPGDFVIWHRRTGLISWRGHLGIVVNVDEDAIIETVEGNVGRVPSKVRRFHHDVTKERLAFFAGLR